MDKGVEGRFKIGEFFPTEGFFRGMECKEGPILRGRSKVVKGEAFTCEFFP
jgi:hypothetical protein